MNALVTRLSVLALSSVALWGQAQSPAPFTISGHVIRHLDQRPASGVRVSLAMVKNPQREVSVVAGDAGEFSFAEIPAGKYQLKVTDRGHTQLYLQDEGFSTAIVTGPGLDTEHILFPLDSPGAITGTIVDDDGDPAPHLQLYLFITSDIEGQSQTHIVTQQQTDLEGTFRFRHLAPGAYYLAVAGRPWYAQSANRFRPRQEEAQPATQSELDVSYPLTYYGGATNFAGASPIKIEEGAKAEIQMAMHAVPALHVKLERLQENNRSFPMMVTQSGPGGFPIHLPVMQNNFEIEGLAPGNYSVQILDQTRNRPSETLSLVLNGDTTLHLGNEANKTSIHGKVLWNGEIPAHLAVELFSDNRSMSSSEAIHADGSFEIPAVTPGRYKISFDGAPDAYVAKAEVKGAAYANGELEVQQGAQIELLLTPGQGRLKTGRHCCSGQEQRTGMQPWFSSFRKTRLTAKRSTATKAIAMAVSHTRWRYSWPLHINRNRQRTRFSVRDSERDLSLPRTRPSTERTARAIHPGTNRSANAPLIVPQPHPACSRLDSERISSCPTT